MSDLGNGEPPEHNITGLLKAWGQGDVKARDTLAELLLKDFSRIARYLFRREGPGHTLETAALVNEAFIDLSQRRKIQFNNSGHLMRVFADVVRRKLVDHARKKKALKRGAGVSNVPFEDHLNVDAVDLVRFSDALQDLRRECPEWSEVVQMRFFCGMKSREIAAALGVHPQTVHNRWRAARAWLYRYLSHSSPKSPSGSQGEDGGLGTARSGPKSRKFCRRF